MAVECGGPSRFNSVVPWLPTPPRRCNAGIVVCDICRRLVGGPRWEHLHVKDHSGLVAQIPDGAMRKVIVEHEEVADAQGHFDDLIFEDVVRPELDTVWSGLPTFGPPVPVMHDVGSASEAATAWRTVRQRNHSLKPLAVAVAWVDVPVQGQGLRSPRAPGRREPA